MAASPSRARSHRSACSRAASTTPGRSRHADLEVALEVVREVRRQRAEADAEHLVGATAPRDAPHRRRRRGLRGRSTGSRHSGRACSERVSEALLDVVEHHVALSGHHPPDRCHWRPLGEPRGPRCAARATRSSPAPPKSASSFARSQRIQPAANAAVERASSKLPPRVDARRRAKNAAPAPGLAAPRKPTRRRPERRETCLGLAGGCAFPLPKLLCLAPLPALAVAAGTRCGNRQCVLGAGQKQAGAVSLRSPEVRGGHCEHAALEPTLLFGFPGAPSLPWMNCSNGWLPT